MMGKKVYVILVAAGILLALVLVGCDSTQPEESRGITPSVPVVETASGGAASVSEGEYVFDACFAQTPEWFFTPVFEKTFNGEYPKFRVNGSIT